MKIINESFRDIKNCIILFLVAHISWNSAILKSNGILMETILYSILTAIGITLSLFVLIAIVRFAFWLTPIISNIYHIQAHCSDLLTGFIENIKYTYLIWRYK